MKLWMLKERWGTYIESPHAPKTVKPKEREAVRKAAAGYLYNLENLYHELRPYGPSLKTLTEWYHYYFMHAFFLLGAGAWRNCHRIAYTYVVRLAHEYALATQVGKVIAILLPTLVVAWMVWLINPQYRSFVQDFGYPWRYMMSYDERFWWADVVYIPSTGYAQYVKCAEIELGPVFHFLDQGKGPGKTDRFELGGGWVQRKSSASHYERWEWDTMWLEFVGMMTNLGGGYYALHYTYRDPWIQDISWPWRTSWPLLCKCARDTP